MFERNPQIIKGQGVVASRTFLHKGTTYKKGDNFPYTSIGTSWNDVERLVRSHYLEPVPINLSKSTVASESEVIEGAVEKTEDEVQKPPVKKKGRGRPKK